MKTRGALVYDQQWLEQLPGCRTERDNQKQRALYLRFLREAVELLPERERQAVLLHDLRGVCAAETAQALGIHPSTVFRRLAAGRQRLRRLAEACERAGLFCAAQQEDG